MPRRANVLDVADVVRTVVAYLEFQAIDNLLVVLQLDDAWSVLLQDRKFWDGIIKLHFGGRLESDVTVLALPQKAHVWQWTASEVACAELQEFLRTGDDRDHFVQTVSIVWGDIGKIQAIRGDPLDALAFRADVFLGTHLTGASHAIFRRAGKGLSDYVNQPDVGYQRRIGDAVSTPAFDAGVRRLIH